MDQKANKSSVSRRKFLQGSVVVAGSALTTKALFARGSVGAADLLRIGLIGCGGRGTGAAAQALAADPNVKLVAMGDAFIDHVENSLAKLKADPKIAGKTDFSDLANPRKWTVVSGNRKVRKEYTVIVTVQ